jgi:hypothetical protein
MTIIILHHGNWSKTMIRLKQIASNMTILNKSGYDILFSYETPVAVYDHQRGEYLRTEQKFSQTTSRHINKWIGTALTISVPQSIIESYVR